MAHQGTAAFNIKGSTLCSSLDLPSGSRNPFSQPYVSLRAKPNGAQKLKNLQERFSNVHLVIIDEHSVISCGMLCWIDQRLREIWPECHDVPFGGRDVVLAGDSCQLGPVFPSGLSTKKEKNISRTST